MNDIDMWNPNLSVQSDGLVTTTKQAGNLVESQQMYVIKEGGVEMSRRFNNAIQAQQELGKLLTEQSGRQLRIAVVDLNGNELLRG